MLSYSKILLHSSFILNNACRLMFCRSPPLVMQPCWLPSRDMYHHWFVTFLIQALICCNFLLACKSLINSCHTCHLFHRYLPHMDQRGWISWDSLKNWRKWRPPMWIPKKMWKKWLELNLVFLYSCWNHYSFCDNDRLGQFFNSLIDHLSSNLTDKRWA